MADTLFHRGPNDGSEWLGDGVALAHRRLSILDLTEAGSQPMRSASGRYVIAFNGEIYNHRDIRTEVGDRDWRGSSDTETLLEAVETWGISVALKKFNGMFAFALWDCAQQKLVLARDRLGEKPLYYGRVGDSFVFGSELKALKKHPEWKGEIDRNALASYMQYGYVPAPSSIFKGISKLIPGAFLVIPRDVSLGHDQVPQSYWSAGALAEQTTLVIPDQGAIDELEQLLRRAIRRQMLADVPLGAFLSGGVDSSTVVALMQAESSRPVKTFSIGFTEYEHNESLHAKNVAAHLATEHTELFVTAADAPNIIPKLPGIYDEPFGDSSGIPTFLLASMARQHVTVALSGDGGDELFGGYNRYIWGDRIWRKIGNTPPSMRRILGRAMTSISPAGWDFLAAFIYNMIPPRLRLTSVGDKIHKLARVIDSRSPNELYRKLTSQHGQFNKIVLDASTLDSWADHESLCTEGVDFVESMMFQDLVSYLPDDVLTKVDRAAMAASLETRVPFLDREIVEFALQLPLSAKFRNGKGKWLLRQVLYRYVPREIIDRPKQGFSLPLDKWLRGPLRDWAEDLLNDSQLRNQGFLNADLVRGKLREHISGQQSWQHFLWNVLMWQAWLADSRNA